MTQRLIVVIREHWVLIGDVVPSKTKATDDLIRLSDASVIRVWGTSAGLGQIALDGPTPNTVLDPCGDVAVARQSVLFTIICRGKP
jgi:hypothetical protein